MRVTFKRVENKGLVLRIGQIATNPDNGYVFPATGFGGYTDLMLVGQRVTTQDDPNKDNWHTIFRIGDHNRLLLKKPATPEEIMVYPEYENNLYKYKSLQI